MVIFILTVPRLRVAIKFLGTILILSRCLMFEIKSKIPYVINFYNLQFGKLEQKLSGKLNRLSPSNFSSPSPPHIIIIKFIFCSNISIPPSH